MARQPMHRIRKAPVSRVSPFSIPIEVLAVFNPWVFTCGYCGTTRRQPSHPDVVAVGVRHVQIMHPERVAGRKS